MAEEDFVAGVERRSLLQAPLDVKEVVAPVEPRGAEVSDAPADGPEACLENVGGRMPVMLETQPFQFPLEVNDGQVARRLRRRISLRQGGRRGG